MAHSLAEVLLGKVGGTGTATIPGSSMAVESLDLLTASDALPNYPSHAEAVNAVTWVKHMVSVIVTLELYICLKDC